MGFGLPFFARVSRNCEDKGHCASPFGSRFEDCVENAAWRERHTDPKIRAHVAV